MAGTRLGRTISSKWVDGERPEEGDALIIESDFFRLVQLANFMRAGRPDFLAYRSRAAAVLAYCAGLRFTETAMLEPRHWMPDGEACILVPGNMLQSSRRVPASPAARWAVDRYLAERGPAHERFMFNVEGGLPLKQEVGNALRSAGLLAGGIQVGYLRAAFQNAILSSEPDNSLSYYLVGVQPPSELPDLDDHPTVGELDGLLRRSGHLYRDVRQLWRA